MPFVHVSDRNNPLVRHAKLHPEVCGAPGAQVIFRAMQRVAQRVLQTTARGKRVHPRGRGGNKKKTQPSALPRGRVHRRRPELWFGMLRVWPDCRSLVPQAARLVRSTAV